MNHCEDDIGASDEETAEAGDENMVLFSQEDESEEDNDDDAWFDEMIACQLSGEMTCSDDGSQPPEEECIPATQPDTLPETLMDMAMSFDSQLPADFEVMLKKEFEESQRPVARPLNATESEGSSDTSEKILIIADSPEPCQRKPVPASAASAVDAKKSRVDHLRVQLANLQKQLIEAELGSQFVHI